MNRHILLLDTCKMRDSRMVESGCAKTIGLRDVEGKLLCNLKVVNKSIRNIYARLEVTDDFAD